MAGAIWVPIIGLGPAFRCFRGNQGRQEPRPDPGYFGCNRTYGARGLLAPERAEFCAGKRAREIYSLGAGAINNRKPCNQTSKQSAGKNIPPNVITTTFVTCLIYLNTYTLLDDKKRVERSKRGSSHALPLFTFNEHVDKSRRDGVA